MKQLFCLLALCIFGINSLQIIDSIPRIYKIDDKETLKYQLKFLLLFKNDSSEEDKQFLANFTPEKSLRQKVDLDLANKFLVQEWLHKGELFSTHNQNHLDQAILLFTVFYHLKSVEDLYKYGIWSQEFVNERMWAYALSVALVHRNDTFGMILPPAYEINPYFFFNTQIMSSVEQSILRHDNPIIIIDDQLDCYTNLDSEQLLTYFTEDIGLNLFYYLYNIFFPWWMDGKEFGLMGDGRGEIFYHIMAQSIARYNVERLSNGLDEVTAINFKIPLDFSYYPSLRYPNGVGFPSRHKGVILQDSVETMALRIRNVIDLGRAYFNIELYKEGVDGLEILSNLLEGNPNSPNLSFYQNIQTTARHVIGYAPEPLRKNKVIPGVIEHYETALRDPATWRFFKWMLQFYKDYYSHVKPYTQNELEYPGVKIESIAVAEITTHFEDFDSDLSQYYKSTSPILIRQKRLNHSPWTYNISVSSNKNQQALVKTFLGPKYDRFGQMLDIKEHKDSFYILDHFSYSLKQGINLIIRNSNDQMLASNRTSYSKLINSVNEALRGEKEFVIDGSEAYWPFPKRLILPRGTVGGMTFQLYTILIPIPNVDKAATKGGVYKRIGSGRHSGVRIRFPLDRNIGKSFFVPNSFVTDITIRHDNKL